LRCKMDRAPCHPDWSGGEPVFCWWFGELYQQPLSVVIFSVSVHRVLMPTVGATHIGRRVVTVLPGENQHATIKRLATVFAFHYLYLSCFIWAWAQAYTLRCRRGYQGHPSASRNVGGIPAFDLLCRNAPPPVCRGSVRFHAR